MTTIKTAKQLLQTIISNNLHKTGDLTEFSIGGHRFNIEFGELGHVDPVCGWYLVHDFNRYLIEEAEGNIQWVFDEFEINA